MLSDSRFLGSRSGLFRSDRQGTANPASRSMRFPRSPAERNHLGGVRRVSLIRQVVAHAFHSQRAKNLAIWQSTPVTSLSASACGEEFLANGWLPVAKYADCLARPYSRSIRKVLLRRKSSHSDRVKT